MPPPQSQHKQSSESVLVTKVTSNHSPGPKCKLSINFISPAAAALSIGQGLSALIPDLGAGGAQAGSGSQQNRWAANEHLQLGRAAATQETTQVLQQPRRTLQHTFKSYLSHRVMGTGLKLQGFLHVQSLRIILNSGMKAASCAKVSEEVLKVEILTEKWKIKSQMTLNSLEGLFREISGPPTQGELYWALLCWREIVT